MLSLESIKQRLSREQNLSFLEFNYSILQAFDFLELNKSGSINAQIEIVDKITFYTKYGNLFSIFNVIILFTLSLHIIFRRLFKNV